MEMRALFQTFLKVTIFIGFAVLIPLLVFSIIKEVKQYYPLQKPEKIESPDEKYLFFNPEKATIEEKEAWRKQGNLLSKYYEDLREFEKKEDSISFSILLLISVLLIIAAIFISEIAIYSGMLAGAISTITFGYLTFHYAISNLVHIILLSAGILLLVFLTYRFLLQDK